MKRVRVGVELKCLDQEKEEQDIIKEKNQHDIEDEIIQVLQLPYYSLQNKD